MGGRRPSALSLVLCVCAGARREERLWGHVREEHSARCVCVRACGRAASERDKARMNPRPPLLPFFRFLYFFLTPARAPQRARYTKHNTHIHTHRPEAPHVGAEKKGDKKRTEGGERGGKRESGRGRQRARCARATDLSPLHSHHHPPPTLASQKGGLQGGGIRGEENGKTRTPRHTPPHTHRDQGGNRTNTRRRPRCTTHTPNQTGTPAHRVPSRFPRAHAHTHPPTHTHPKE